MEFKKRFKIFNFIKAILILSLFFIGLTVFFNALVNYQIRKYYTNSKILTDISISDRMILEKECFGFDFPKGVKIEKMKLHGGKDSGVTFQFKSNQSFEKYVENLKSKLSLFDIRNEGYRTLDGDEIVLDSLQGAHEKVVIYRKNGFYFLELFSRGATEKVLELYEK